MSSRNLFVAATIACMTGCLFGYSVGFIGGILVLPSFLRHFRLDHLPAKDIALAQSKIVSSWIVGCTIGVPIGVPICSKYGRKLCIIFSASLYIVGTLLQVLDGDGMLGIFQLARLINGIGVGAGTLVSPLYITETSSPDQRPTLMSGFQVTVQSFALLGFWGAFICHSIFDTTSNLQWQVPVLFQLIPGIILLIGGLFILPESPQWLISKGETEAARKALSWLRMTDQDSDIISTEVVHLEKVVKTTNSTSSPGRQKSFVKQITSPPLRKRMFVGAGLMILQNLCGLNALNYYSPIIFISAGYTSVSSSLFLTGLFGLVKLITSLAFMFIFIRLRGNRFWLLLGSATMAICMFILAFCIEQLPTNINTNSNSNHTISSPSSSSISNAYGITAVLMVNIFAFAFGISLGPISWNVCAEIFPSRINIQACAVTTCIQWLGQILIAAITPPLIASIGWGTYLIYGVCCVLSFIWCALYVPETKGVAIGPDMDRAFGDDAKSAGDDDELPEVEEIEDVGGGEVDETTPLVVQRRRRSSIALVV